MNITERQPPHNDYERSVLANVEKFGWHCTSVSQETGSREVPFTYTVGLFYTYRQPEFIVAGLDAGVSHSILSALADVAASQAMYPMNEPCHELIDGYPCMFVEVPRARYNDYVLSSLWFYAEHSFPLYQVVWPDRNGRFPWHRLATKTFKAEQPILGRA
jgi:hypothetical protein